MITVLAAVWRLMCGGTRGNRGTVWAAVEVEAGCVACYNWQRERRGSRNGVAVEGRSGGGPGSVAVQRTWLSRWLWDAASTEMCDFRGEVGGGDQEFPSGLP